MLTNDRINQLASGKNVKRIAVENFLLSLNGLTYEQAVRNCGLAAASYRWNHATITAIGQGIFEHFQL